MLTAASGITHDLSARWLEARHRGDGLFSLLREDVLYQRPISERHRIIFYIGHLEAFDWNLLHERALGVKSRHPEFDRLFAFGIDPVGGGLPSDQASDWPSLDAVRNYVAASRKSLDGGVALADCEADTGDGLTLTTLLQVAIEHRLMHLETLAYMLHQLPFAAKIAQVDPPQPAVATLAPRMIAIPAGTATLGLASAGDEFGWDNEYQVHTSAVPAFEIDQYKVTNAQFQEFITSGGYESRELWDEDAWSWKTAKQIAHPVFWRKSGGAWLYRTMFEEIPLPLDWPVYVSHAEASAYARWTGKALPTEPEWHRAAYGAPDRRERKYPWGDSAPAPDRGNFDFQRWNPVAVNAFDNNRSAFGAEGMLGNGWEWTSTVFAPFQGFQPFPFYRGYSADFFDGKHFVMKGGSARTAACMLRPTFRNWFQAHYQYVYAGFRCVRR